MLDLERLRRLDLAAIPRAQIALAETVLRMDYRFPRRTEIVVEGIERIPRDRPVFLALNHTDAYNYWPFQYAMYRHGGLRYTSVWVKGKYYGHRWMAAFLDAMNNIPVPSRGYLLTEEFRRRTGRLPGEAEYRWARNSSEGDPDFEERFDRLMAQVTRLTRRAFALDLNVLVFPQGTRSKRTSRGRTGLMQMAQHLGASIVPVGSNGSDRLYPGSSPFSKGGRVVYRVGEALDPDGPALAPHRVRSDFVPFSHAASTRHGEAFQAATDVLMEHIDALLDEEYRSLGSGRSDGVQGVRRFA